MADTQLNFADTSATPAQEVGFIHAPDQETNVLPIREQIVLVQHALSCWSGKVVLDEEADLNVEAGKSLVKEAQTQAGKGQKWIVDPLSLNPFQKIKKRFTMLLEQEGLRFMGGYAVPSNKWVEIKNELDSIVKEYEKARQDFLGRYEGLVQTWADSHPLMSGSIRAAAPSKEEMEGKITAAYIGVRLNPVSEADTEQLEKSLAGLSDELISSVRQVASLYVKTCLSEGGKPLRSVKALEGIAVKLRSLGFLANGAAPLADVIESEVKAVRRPDGSLNNSNPFLRSKIMGICAILMSEDSLKKIIEGTMGADEVRACLTSNFGVAPTADAPVTLQLISEQEESAVQNKSDSVSEPVDQTANSVTETQQTDTDDLEAFFEAQSAAVEVVAEEKKEEANESSLFIKSEKPAAAMTTWF